MKNIIKNSLVFTILIFIFIKRPEVISGILDGVDLWNKYVFPSIFPILIISDLILSTNIINLISNIFGGIFKTVFKVSKYSSYVFFMSLFSGSPSNAKYINDLLVNNIIDKNEAIKILSMSLLYNPLLIISITSFLDIKDTFYLLGSNVLANIIVGLINRNYKCNITSSNIKPKEFNLVSSINNSINVLLLILGSMLVFIIINVIIPIKHPLITGFMEITNGINMIKIYNINYKYKFIFSSILMGFGGFSILYQIKSIFKDTNLDFSLYYKSRIIHIILMILLAYIKTIYISGSIS